MIAVEDDLAFETAREFQVLDEGIARIAISRVGGSIPGMQRQVARVVIRRSSTQLDPVHFHLEIARIVDACSRIEVIHPLISGALYDGNNYRKRSTARQIPIGLSGLVLGRIGSCGIASSRSISKRDWSINASCFTRLHTQFRFRTQNRFTFVRKGKPFSVAVACAARQTNHAASSIVSFG